MSDALIATLLAPCCACCRDPLEQPTRGAVCPACWASIPLAHDPLCETCGDALSSSWRTGNGHDRRCSRCRRSHRVITCGRSVGPYEAALRDIVHALKYEGRRSVARPLGALMIRAGASVLDGADFAVPVPLHLARHYARGFNQAAELAAHVGLPVVDALRRQRATTTQTDLPEGQRHANVKDAFRLRRRIPAGSVVVVVDDVSTTGATVDACARVLLAAGAREVRALTAARAAARLP
ncbi:MAG: double zinc ribbon domain-containing protein [Acidobacteriota bacterium]|nr:double zinc ribbon domain-containing protein [Acidobacteriota bacterium]